MRAKAVRPTALGPEDEEAEQQEQVVVEEVPMAAAAAVDVLAAACSSISSTPSSSPLSEVGSRCSDSSGASAIASSLRVMIPHQLPTLSIDAHGSAISSASPFCRSSIEMSSGDFTNAMRPSRGGRLIVTPPF